MSGAQKVIISGTLSRDAEITDKGMTKFSIPVEDSYKDKNGDRHTEWFNLVYFGKDGAVAPVSKFLVKGKIVTVEARIKTREHDGKKYTDYIVEKLQLLGDRNPRATASEETSANADPF